jgi:tetratricopeptide (TPR) repeat protein
LARAYIELGEIEQARKAYQKVLSLDLDNPIASKNLKRLSKTSPAKKTFQKRKKITAGGIFLEEPGKTKVVKLVKLASSSVLSNLDNADPVYLVPKKRRVSVTTGDGVYLGSIPDDLSRRLIRLIQGGNRYEAFIKAIEKGELQIFIRETFRARRFKNLPSFTHSRIPYSPYLNPETFYKEKPEVSPTGEENPDE